MALRIAWALCSLLRVFVLLVVLDGATATNFCQQVVQPLGYDCAEYTVQTGDGFVLALHRLGKSSSLVGDGLANSSASAPAGAPAGAPASAPAFAPSPSPGHPDVSAPPEASSPAPRERRNNSSMLADASSNMTSSKHPFIKPHPVAAGVAPIVTRDPLSSSPNGRTADSGLPSNYTINPGAGKSSPVLLMHQEFVSGEVWFQFADANRSVAGLLPIMLLNDGYDVWIGHHRATYWSHGHIRLQTTDREYWNWTWDQHVQYDLPAILLFISAEASQPVHFIGASQAASSGAALATDHEAAQMIRSLTLIGPTAYRGYTNSVLLEAWAYYFGLTLDSEYYVTGYQNGAFNYSREFPRTGPFSGDGLSETAINLISGPNCCLSDSAPLQFTNGWDGTTSFKNLLHWQQGIRTNTFAHYDYGSPTMNMQAYGRPSPPVYNVAQIPRRMPVLVIGGGQDYEAPPQGIRLFLSQLQQPLFFINLTNYAHYDLGFSIYRERDMYLPILQYLEAPRFP